MNRDKLKNLSGLKARTSSTKKNSSFFPESCEDTKEVTTINIETSQKSEIDSKFISGVKPFELLG